ncbi:hypothetical protein PTKIN_Ptkin03bG0205700 [Pterospermum kingtungense]
MLFEDSARSINAIQLKRLVVLTDREDFLCFVEFLRICEKEQIHFEETRVTKKFGPSSFANTVRRSIADILKD